MYYSIHVCSRCGSKFKCNPFSCLKINNTEFSRECGDKNYKCECYKCYAKRLMGRYNVEFKEIFLIHYRHRKDLFDLFFIFHEDNQRVGCWVLTKKEKEEFALDVL